METVMNWSKMDMDGAVLTLWPSVSVKNTDLESVHAFFKKVFDIVITPVGCVTTLPDKNEDGEDEDGTGGRIDFFFYVRNEDVPKFAIKRFAYGMRWWSDVYFNQQEDIYPLDFRKVHPECSA